MLLLFQTEGDTVIEDNVADLHGVEGSQRVKAGQSVTEHTQHSLSC